MRVHFSPIKLLNLSLYFLLTCTFPLLAGEVIGFWNTLNQKTYQPESIAAIYEYQGKVYGRLIALYDKFGNVTETIYAPKSRAPGVKGHPFYCGLDFIWNLQKEGDKYHNGKVMDPEKGKIYDAEMWEENDVLILRGEVMVFGRNEKWTRTKESEFPKDFKKPDLATLVPVIPEVN